MSDNSASGRTTGIGEGYAIPITGLLSVLFAVMAGGTAYPAVTSGSIGLATLPVIFGAASLISLLLRKRFLEAKSE